MLGGFMKFKMKLQKHFDEMQKKADYLFEVNQIGRASCRERV